MAHKHKTRTKSSKRKFITGVKPVVPALEHPEPRILLNCDPLNYDSLKSIQVGVGETIQISETPIELLLKDKPGSEVADSVQKEYRRLLAKHRMMLALIGSEDIKNKIEQLFPYTLSKESWILCFDTDDAPSLRDYSRFFGSIDRIYRLLITLIKKDYFVTRWISGAVPNYVKEDLFNVTILKKQSPGEIQGTAVKECITGLKDILSVGKQGVIPASLQNLKKVCGGVFLGGGGRSDCSADLRGLTLA